MTRRIEKRQSLVEMEERSPQGQREMAAARSELEAVTLLDKALQVSGVSQKELARRVGVSEGRVSQVLSNEARLQVATVARYLRALGYQLRLIADPVELGAVALPSRAGRRRRGNGLPPLQVSADVVTTDSGTSSRIHITLPGVPPTAGGSAVRVVGEVDQGSSRLNVITGSGSQVKFEVGTK